jgi:hypothetical protein
MKGFIALMSVIIVSIILLGLALSGSTIAFFTRMSELDQESYKQAQSLARSCGDQALLQLAQNYNYTATHLLVKLGTDQCYIESITILTASTTQSQVQIQTSASHHNSYATYATTTVVAY